ASASLELETSFGVGSASSEGAASWSLGSVTKASTQLEKEDRLNNDEMKTKR
ncbi:MAG: hypothetical protein ACI92S_002992, partial [Planctomycetaceae bacterium]